MSSRMRLALVGCLSGLAACGSGSSGPVFDSEIHPTGFPFVVEANVATDVCGAPIDACAAGRNPPPGATTATLGQPEDGKICLTGTVSASGYAFAVVVFTQYDDAEDKVLATFNADALGISQVAFTIDSPASGGVTVLGAVVKQLDCPGSANGVACRTTGFRLATEPGSQTALSIAAAGPQIAPFANFEQTNPASSPIFDTTALDSFAFFVGPGSFDFCVHDFKLLDAAGNEVKP